MHCQRLPTWQQSCLDTVNDPTLPSLTLFNWICCPYPCNQAFCSSRHGWTKILSNLCKDFYHLPAMPHEPLLWSLLLQEMVASMPPPSMLTLLHWNENSDTAFAMFFWPSTTPYQLTLTIPYVTQSCCHMILKTVIHPALLPPLYPCKWLLHMPTQLQAQSLTSPTCLSNEPAIYTTTYSNKSIYCLKND